MIHLVSKFVRASYISNADFRERIIDNLKDDRKVSYTLQWRINMD